MVKCRHCQSEYIAKNGHRGNGTQRWRCNSCRKSFQLGYTYNAHKSGVKEQIIEQTLNSRGVRDIAGISKLRKAR